MNEKTEIQKFSPPDHVSNHGFELLGFLGVGGVGHFQK
jgi:hypothetical protein